MKFLDVGFEIIATGIEMIDACVEAHGTLFEPQYDKSSTKSDHPASFEESLCFDDDDASNIRGRR